MAYDAYQAHEWQHGDVITSQLLNNLEQAVASSSTVTKNLNELQYNENLIPEGTIDDGSYDAVHGTENNKIETSQSVDRKISAAINALDVTNLSINGSSSTLDDDNNTGYQRILTKITQTNGKIESLKYKTLPAATKFTNTVDDGTLGLVRIGQDLNIDNGTLSGGYAIDSLSGFQGSIPEVSYNNNSSAAGYNPLTTVKSVDYRIKNIIGGACSLDTQSGNPAPSAASLTITGIISNALNGTIELTRSPISISHTHVNDIYIDGNPNASGDHANKYTIPTLSTMNTAIQTQINTLNVDNATSGDGTHITGFDAGKTLATLIETNGKIGATFQNISIIKSQVSDLETLRSLTTEEIEDRDEAIQGNEEWVDPRKSEGLLSTSDYDTFIELVQPMDSAPVSGTDTRPAGGLITPTDKDNLDTLFAKNDLLVTMTSAPVSGTDEREDAGLISKTDKDALDILLNNVTIDSNGNIVGIKIYNAEGTAYKTLTYSGLIEPEPEL